MPVTLREGDSVPHDMAKAAGWLRDDESPASRPPAPAPASRPAAVGPVIAEAGASFGPPAQPQGFDALAGLAAGQRPKRPVTWFVFPPKIHSEMEEVRPEHRVFAICRLKAVEEQRAQANASGTSFMSAFTEQVKESVWKLGNDDATFDLKEGHAGPYGPGGWWEAIGPKGRQLVSRCYAEVNGVSDELGEEILASKKTGWA